MGKIMFVRGIAAVLPLVFLACSGTPKPPRIEDERRQMAPLPACIKRLQGRRGGTGLQRTLAEEGYWQLVFPSSYDTAKQSLPDGAVPCTGRPVFDDPAFAGAERIREYPSPIAEGEILLGSGGDRLKVIWLRTHHLKDGFDVGPLALVRVKEEFAEVYAIGVYKGLTKKPYFALERIGPEVVVTAQDDGCIGNTKSIPCRSMLTVLLPRRGKLATLATFALEQRDFAAGGEPGAPGRIEYRLTASPKFVESGVQLFEQVLATDEGGRELRKAEVERSFTLNDLELVPSEDSLWPRIFPTAPE